MENLRFELETSPSAMESVKSFLRDHNQSANPIFWSKLDVPEGAPEALNVVAYDSDGEVVGGLLAETSFSWLKLRILSVRADTRHQGIGSQLVRQAESEACSHGCKYAFVDTMEYQAPAFFRRLGYRVVGEIADWDSHDHTKYFMTKSLPSAD